VHFTQIFANLYWEVIQAILLIAVLWAFLSATDLFSTLLKNKLTRRNDVYGEMTVTIIHRSVNTILFTILLIFLMENVFSLNIGALITGLGIIGLAISLAGKESAQNLFGAISIFVNHPFVVGDWVMFKGNLGEVRDVAMQATYIRLLSGEMLIVPNMQFVSNEVEKLGMRKYLRREMDIALPYGTPPEKVKKAREVVKDILEREEIVKEGKFNLEETPASVSFSGYGDYYLNLKVYYWYYISDDGQTMQRNADRGWFTYLEHCTLVNQAILEAFDEHDIEFAFPTQTVKLERKKKPGEASVSSDD
jgi:MscS family membrane protein